MRRFFKILFIIFLSLFACGMCGSEAKEIITPHLNEHYIAAENSVVFYQSNKFNDTAIAAPNNNGYQIYSYRKNSNDTNTAFRNTASQNRTVAQYFNYYLNNIINCKFHNISPNLENEICTRAP